MLRMMFNEPKRKDEGELLQAFRAIEEYRSKLARMGPKSRLSKRNGKLSLAGVELWAQSFIDALDELEQSKYCAGKCADRVTSAYVEDMEEEERDYYKRYLYFYKNAIIRIFSTLDKLGYFLNDLYSLGTEKVKSRFSYFTVLRQMHETRIETELEQKLYILKNATDEPLRRLRTQRNMEIHLLNAELVDDMMRVNHAVVSDEDRQKVENLKQNMSDLERSYLMVCRAVETAFHNAKKSARK